MGSEWTSSKERELEIAMEYIRRRAAEIVEEKCRKSTTLHSGMDQVLPLFQSQEIQVGKVLGKGGYCTVSEIKRVTLANEELPKMTLQQDQGPRDKNDDDFEDIHCNAAGSYHITQDRKYMATRYLRHGKDARYAIKTLSADTKEDPHRFIAGVVDLAIEARFLSIIRHPNIIKMRATADISPYEPGFFIILDRLYDTLSVRIRSWRKRKTFLNSFGRFTDSKGIKKIDFIVERLLVGLDLSSALGYLHSHNIIYRDLKPDNIGFDVRGDVKLFDFGLSIEMAGKNFMTNEVYDLSGNTGSLRYMAPEVGLEKLYNHKVDVYSFGLLLWQIISLKTPYEGFTVDEFSERVVRGGERPAINGSSWTESLRSLVSTCWSEDIMARPEFSQISTNLKEIIFFIRGDGNNVLFLDRSDHTEKSL